MASFKIEPTMCPTCHKIIDACGGHAYRLIPNDVAFCIYCETFSVFNEKLQLEEMSVEDRLKLLSGLIILPDEEN